MSLADWLVEQRWFASKGREITEVDAVQETELRDGVRLSILEVRFPEGTHELYQVLRAGDEDALEGDPARARVLLELMREGAEIGDVRFEWTGGGSVPDGEIRQMGVEQSNTSIVFGEEVILKVLRRLEAGDNPELELLRFLSARGFPHIAPLVGYYEHEGRLIHAALGIAQEFLPGAQDGWAIALETLGAGGSFDDEARALGTVTGELHAALASDGSDPHFAPEEPSEEALSLIMATIDEEIDRVFRDLPSDDERVASIAGCGEDVRELLRAYSHVGVGGRVIRAHGDYHLGQTLKTRRGWVVLDFEGEPARPLLERRRKRSPLRDVAGMLRSFAYAATAADAPEGWEARTREVFLDAYLAAVDSVLLPPGEDATAKLLAMFELEKAVYELRYELNHRPDWVGIPVAGIRRLLQEA